MGASTGNGKIISGINVTPLVDIVLVLLIIFMATAHFIAHRMVPMNLPKAAHSENKPTPSVQVTLSQDKSIYLDNRGVTKEELILNLTRMAQLDPNLRVTVAADAQVVWDDVAGILDNIRGCGIQRIGAEVHPKNK